MSSSDSSKDVDSDDRILQQEYYQINLATLEDVESLVALHYKCFTKEDHIAMLFGKPFILATYKWFVTSPETFVLVARLGDSLIGFQSISERSYDAPMLRASWREALMGLIFHPWLAFHPELLRRLIRLIFRRHKVTPDSNHEAHLAFIGVDPQFQGRGIGKALINEAVRSCRERGMNAIITGVMRRNVRSKAMFIGKGFSEAPELGTKRFVYFRLDLSQHILDSIPASQLGPDALHQLLPKRTAPPK
jgi:ribosomal protein S18 acetylase RimI-like enzyme